MELSSGLKVQHLDDEVKQQYQKDVPGIYNDVVKLEPGGWIMTKRFLDLEKKVYNFKFRPDDVVIMTYPKCGTTWMQEIIWTMRENPNLDNPDVGDGLFVRSPFIELDMWLPTEMSQEEIDGFGNVFMKGYEKYVPVPNFPDGIAFQIAEGHKKSRGIKTHLPFPFFPKNLLDMCKVVYVGRNPKDQLLSELHHYKTISHLGFTGTLDDFVDYYVKGKLQIGSYAKHLAEAWERRGHPNFRMVFYEDLKADIAGQVTKLDKFLGTNLTQQQMNNVIHKTSFKTMKEEDTMRNMKREDKQSLVTDESASLLRKGEAGAWRGQYTPEQEAKLDAWINENFKFMDQSFKFY